MTTGTGTGAEFELLVSRPPPGVELECRPLVRLPVDHEVWARDALEPDARTVGIARASEAEPEVRIDIKRARSSRTDEGWLLRIVRSDVVGPSGVIERRVHGLYAIDCYGGVVIARGDVDDHREQVEDLLRTARARHRPRVVAIAQVWQGFAAEDSP